MELSLQLVLLLWAFMTIRVSVMFQIGNTLLLFPQVVFTVLA